MPTRPYRIARQYVRGTDVQLRNKWLSVPFDANSVQTFEIDDVRR